MTAHLQIVIAWADKTALEPTGRFVTRDLNRFPEYRAAWEGKAAMWLRKGTAANIPEAQAYINLNAATYTASAVYTFPPSEQDPLGKARARAVAAAKQLETA